MLNNHEDVIDSRDVIARIEELEAQDTRDADEAQELEALQALAKQGEEYAADWGYGEFLVRDSYFTAYARELLEDCGIIPRDTPHYVEIDWEATARNIRVDYTAVDYSGVTYWIR